MKEIEFHTLDEVLDDVVGLKGTPRREALETDFQEFLLGETIKQARKERNLTQEELGAMAGVGRQQVSRIEREENVTFSLFSRLLKALGLSGSVNVAGFGQVTL